MKLLKNLLLLTIFCIATACTPTSDVKQEEGENSLTGGADAGTIDDGKD